MTMDMRYVINYSVKVNERESFTSSLDCSVENLQHIIILFDILGTNIIVFIIFGQIM